MLFCMYGLVRKTMRFMSLVEYCEYFVNEQGCCVMIHSGGDGGNEVGGKN